MLVKLGRIFLIAMVMVSGLTTCTKKPAAHEGAVQTGVASWYGQQFQGRLTASGEPFDMAKMTAAHRTLPFGAKVRVQSLVNQKTTEVRINDRGPFAGDRIIDLSHAAAQAIDMPGIANVRLEVLSVPSTRGVDVFAVQVGEFSQRADAQKLVEKMQQQYGSARLVFRDEDRTWRVLVGMGPTMERAEALAQQLQKDVGPDVVVRVDTEE